MWRFVTTVAHNKEQLVVAKQLLRVNKLAEEVTMAYNCHVNVTTIEVVVS